MTELQPIKNHGHTLEVLAALLTIIFIVWSLYKSRGSSTSTGSSSSGPIAYGLPGGSSSSGDSSGALAALAAQVSALEQSQGNSVAVAQIQADEAKALAAIQATAAETMAQYQAQAAEVQAENNISLSWGNNFSNGIQTLLGSGSSDSTSGTTSTGGSLNWAPISIGGSSSGSSSSGGAGNANFGAEAVNDNTQQFTVSGLNAGSIGQILSFLQGTQATAYAQSTQQNQFDAGMLSQGMNSQLAEQMLYDLLQSNTSNGVIHLPDGSTISETLTGTLHNDYHPV
jgi:hypothetical protein